MHDLATFRRFLALVASRHGQVLNKSDLAAPLGLSVPAIGRWLAILEATAQVLVVPPYFDNLGKRIIKSPKVYIADSGLACHLLGIETEAELKKSPFRGAIFEGFIAAEVIKAQTNIGRRRELYYFRDQQGLEVDFVVPGPGGKIRLIEAKASATVTPATAVPNAAPLGSLAQTRASRLGRHGVGARGDGEPDSDACGCAKRPRLGVAQVRRRRIAMTRRSRPSGTVLEHE